ncbi:MAG TPA: ester cyclase [Ktedonobacteraceae bacterium]
MKDLFGEYFTGFPDPTCETVAVHAITEDLAVWRWVVHGTNTGSFRGLPPTGRSVVLRGCDFIAVREGLV